jgi:hypothetical protein
MQNQLNTPNSSRIRPDNVLAHLPPEDQEKIIEWLDQMTYRAAVEQLAKPRPEGLGLKTHITSLRRFYGKQASVDFLLDQDPEIWQEAVEQVSSNPVEFRLLIVQALARQVVLALNRFPEDPKTALRLLDRWLRCRGYEFKERALIAKQGGRISGAPSTPDLENLLQTLLESGNASPSETDSAPQASGSKQPPRNSQPAPQVSKPAAAIPPHNSAPHPLPQGSKPIANQKPFAPVPFANAA